MPVPTQQEIDERKKQTEKKIADLRSAYEQFLSVWSDIEKEEQELLEEMHQHIDRSQLHGVLKKIDSIKH